MDHSQLLLMVDDSQLAQLFIPSTLTKLKFLSLFKKILSVYKQGSFFNEHFQILPALSEPISVVQIKC